MSELSTVEDTDVDDHCSATQFLTTALVLLEDECKSVLSELDQVSHSMSLM